MKYLFICLLVVNVLFAQEKMKPEDTEVWEPEPKVVSQESFILLLAMQRCFMMVLIFLNGGMKSLELKCSGK